MRRQREYSTSTHGGCVAENNCASCQSLSPSTCNVEVPAAPAWQMGEKWEDEERVLSSVPASCKPSSTTDSCRQDSPGCDVAGLDWLSV